MTGLAERVKAAEDWLKDHWKFVALVSGGSLLVSAGYLYYQSASSGKKPGKRRDIKTEGTPATQMEDVSSFDITADLNQVSLEEKEAAAVTTEQSAPSTDDEKEMSEEVRVPLRSHFSIIHHQIIETRRHCHQSQNDRKQVLQCAQV